MSPQIRCPQCGLSINLENRKKTDMNIILKALQVKHRSFTELLNISHLPRKTLSLRLNELVASGKVLKNGDYSLSGATAISLSGGYDNTKLKKNLVNLRKSIVLLFLIFCIGVPTAYHVYARLVPPAPDLPVASFTISPRQASYLIVWEQLPTGEISYQYPTVHFAAAKQSGVSFTWDLGDGTIAGNEAVTHTYKDPGTYTVTLTAVNRQGLNDTAQDTVNVQLVETVISVETPADELMVGETFTVTISATNLQSVSGWQLQLLYNPDVLECTSFEKSGVFTKQQLVEGYDDAYLVDEGLFPGSSGMTLWIPPTIDNEVGAVGICGCCYWASHAKMGSVSGDGSFAEATFKVVGSGVSNLEISSMLLLSTDGSKTQTNLLHGQISLP